MDLRSMTNKKNLIRPSFDGNNIIMSRTFFNYLHEIKSHERLQKKWSFVQMLTILNHMFFCSNTEGMTSLTT